MRFEIDLGSTNGCCNADQLKSIKDLNKMKHTFVQNPSKSATDPTKSNTKFNEIEYKID